VAPAEDVDIAAPPTPAKSVSASSGMSNTPTRASSPVGHGTPNGRISEALRARLAGGNAR